MRPHVEGDFRGTPRFQVLRRLGTGGMGVVYEALDRETGARVALKTLRTPSPDSLLRLKREFRALQDIQHTNLVTLGELVEDGGVWFFTMELVGGVNFLDYVRRTPGGAGPEADTVRLSQSADTAELPPGVDAWGALAGRPAGAGGGFDPGRLRRGLAQLARGLSALHAAGKIHRDVKPSNILVTDADRVVLLDFGLVTDVEPLPGMTDDNVVGTSLYMAPEQAASRPVGPEADWYGVGVVLYEALVGAPPFLGTHMEVLMNKQQREPPPPRAHVAGLPADLDALCAELLRRDPFARPSGAEILRRVASDEGERADEAVTPSGPAPPFVGREPELAFLQRALEDVRAGRQVSVYLHGESGIGKSALVRVFTDRARADRRVVVLAGRCYERELVPFKAVDGLIDALGQYLERLPPDRADALMPRAASLLPQVFPVLRRVGALAGAPVQEVPPDPQELRSRVFGALRELVGRLADRRTLIVVLDDLQWADADSIALLAEILRPPEAPPLLLVACWRETTTGAAGIRQRLLGLPGEIRQLELGPLPPEQARGLADLLLASAGLSASSGSAAAMASDAGGHPWFLGELIRYQAAHGAGGAIALEDALWARIQDLEPAARDLLELVTVAAAPVDQDVAAAAAGMALADLAGHAARLRALNLVRTGGARTTDRIEPYHDRVRQTVIDHLDEPRRRGRHGELARALEASGRASPDALALHWRESGDAHAAIGHAIRAAEQATRALAFDHAAELYRMALELGGGPELQVALGDALARAGRGAEAAGAFLAAAAGAGPGEALDLQRRAAEEYLKSGHIDDGLETIRAVLARVGLDLPATPRRSLLSLLARRARLGLRGLGFRERDEAQVPAEVLARIDVCSSVAKGLAYVDPIRAADFQTRGLLLALAAGEPYRIGRALALEACLVSTEGGPVRRRVDRLAAASEAILSRFSTGEARGWRLAPLGLSAYLQGRWKDGLRLLIDTERHWSEQGSALAWERSNAQMARAWCLYYLGELAELERYVARIVKEADDRGDLYLSTNLRTFVPSLIWLARDDPDRLEREVRSALARWSREGFHLQHYDAMISEVNAMIYRGEGARALATVDAARPQMKATLIHRIQAVRVEVNDLSGRAALTEAARPGADRDRFLATARGHARRLEREKMPWSDALAGMLRAGLTAAAGSPGEAAAGYAATAAALEACDMALHAAVARRRHGELAGGDDGRALVAAADAWMADQKVVAPARMTALLAPGPGDW